MPDAADTAPTFECVTNVPDAKRTLLMAVRIVAIWLIWLLLSVGTMVGLANNLPLDGRALAVAGALVPMALVLTMIAAGAASR